MDSQKNDLYKTKLRGDEIYALVYIFSDIYGGLGNNCCQYYNFSISLSNNNTYNY